jgi:hypothetical protein
VHEKFSKEVTREYDKQNQQGKAAFNERNPYMTQQQEPVKRSPGGPKTKIRRRGWRTALSILTDDQTNKGLGTNRK